MNKVVVIEDNADNMRLIISDALMPAVDGLELLRMLKTHDEP